MTQVLQHHSVSTSDCFQSAVKQWTQLVLGCETIFIFFLPHFLIQCKILIVTLFIQMLQNFTWLLHFPFFHLDKIWYRRSRRNVVQPCVSWKSAHSVSFQKPWVWLDLDGW